MATAEVLGQQIPIRFDSGEVAGALGDSITVLPLVVALGALTDASLGLVLLGFAVFQAVWGLHYGLPMSVEPMKALAGLAIAGTLGYGELVAAGLLAGGVLLVAGTTGLVGRVAALVGRPVVRGVQFAVALLLLAAGVELAAGAPVVAAGGVVVAAGAALVDRRAPAPAVLLAGTLAALYAVGGAPTVALPTFPGSLAALPEPHLTPGALTGLAGQLAMTVGNAAVATALLVDDLYARDVSPDGLARSMGVTNLVAVPLGGVPMCHGSGGLAGKHAFGARTAGANLVLAALYAGAALVAGLWSGFPMAALGVLLVLVAVHLGRVALESVATPAEGAVVVGTGVVALAANVGVAFLLAAVGHAGYERLRARGAAAEA
ncbi:putative sulfate/molybdate transporter [Haloglomus litoreum]|uniref:putative sulfate/molybdate transporter n=1 Tax=Haloglomus litoreum TaxID=3034026 RepID=UPI0023E88FCD|nr:putative sulfate/molybdate transporter [Haloglomus sp. DT116]